MFIYKLMSAWCATAFDSYNVNTAECLTTSSVTWIRQTASREADMPSDIQKIRHIYGIRKSMTAFKSDHSEPDESSPHIPILFI